MDSIQRLNYYTSQFLIDRDFQDEQAYHREMRHRHNRSLHTPGVVEGLAVSKAGDRQIKVSAGMAIDRDGQEIIVLEESGAISLSGSNTNVFVTIRYQEELKVPDGTNGLEDKFRRTQEAFAIESFPSRPSAEGSTIVLASVKLDANGNIEGEPDNQVRIIAGAAIAAKSIGTEQLSDGAVTKSKIAISPADISALAISGGSIQGSLTVTDTFQLKSGTAINEFSDDVSLSSNSSSSVPTVHAVKASVDALNKRIDTLTNSLDALNKNFIKVTGDLNESVNKRALADSLNDINRHLTGIVNDLNRRVTKLGG